MEFMRARTAAAIAAGSTAAFIGLGFTAVYREGFETVLFYQALSLFAAGLGLYVWLGVAAAVAALGGRRLRDHRPRQEAATQADADHRRVDPAAAEHRLPRQRGALAAVGRRHHATPVHAGWARLPVFVAELTGIHPTTQGLIAQAVLLAIFALGAAWVFWLQPLRARRVSEVTTA